MGRGERMKVLRLKVNVAVFVVVGFKVNWWEIAAFCVAQS